MAAADRSRLAVARGAVLLRRNVVLTWPLVPRAHEATLPVSPDTHLFIWTLAWDTHAVIHQPLAIFDSNIYYPEPRTLRIPRTFSAARISRRRCCGRRQSAAGHERRRAAVGGPVRAGSVSAGASRRHSRRCRPGRGHLRVRAGAAVPDQPAAPHHDSVGAVHARRPSAQVSREQEPQRPEAGDRVLHAAGADLGPRRSLRDRASPR